MRHEWIVIPSFRYSSAGLIRGCAGAGHGSDKSHRSEHFPVCDRVARVAPSVVHRVRRLGCRNQRSHARCWCRICCHDLCAGIGTGVAGPVHVSACHDRLRRRVVGGSAARTSILWLHANCTLGGLLATDHDEKRHAHRTRGHLHSGPFVQAKFRRENSIGEYMKNRPSTTPGRSMDSHQRFAITQCRWGRW